jgi:hypothetical protein
MANARLVQTSRGTMEIAFLELFRRTGFMVAVRVYDEDGWEVGETQKWFAKESDQTLAEFLASSVQLGEPEASDLAVEIQEWWGLYLDENEADFGKAKREALIIFIGLGLLAVLALLGLALLVYVLAT